MASRAEKRAARENLQKEIAKFIKIQEHYFPELISDIKKILDARHQSYITYNIEVIIYTMIMKNVCSIASMQEMTEEFTMKECAANIYKILGLEEKNFLPHYVTINECLEKLDPNELEKIRKKLIYSLIRKKSFDSSKFIGKYWLVIVDASQLFSFDKRHCEHCLTKVVNKGEENEKTIYYHQVLEAKIVMGEDMIFSIATEFIANESEGLSKQDCEIKAFKRLAKEVNKMFPRLPICIMGDSLYASGPVFDICIANNWQYLIRFKDGSIPNLAKEYKTIKAMGEAGTINAEEIIIHKRKPNQKKSQRISWVNEIEYNRQKVTVIEMDEKGEKRALTFKWISSMEVTERNATIFANTGRKRWLIENEGFNIQKNHRYYIEHANSLDYNAMKNHYLITQISDILLQLYEVGTKGLKMVCRTITAISKMILESLKDSELTKDDLIFERTRVST